eukprot:CAMPEP_0116045436 /NCGR_PEP_ID=MMETSP0321-20121206/27617_1 /TAXON_ID=163516 /ORGANISM="Leptocylindrus danicus var. danicus, Strain B650" /LENGTH=673 /DNA_ID=CAMNT_0003526769 /DNA_START=124 /DNA_END=2145 /DNA_ORIENTATION=+
MDLKEENNAFLQESLKRCMSELQFYQKQSGWKETPPKQGIDLPNWIMSSKGVSPLFIAYDQRISEVTKLLNDQGKKLEDMTERSQRLLKENALLREAQTESLKSALSTGKVAINDSNASTSCGWRQERLTKENALIHEQCGLLMKELKMANDAIVTKDKSIADLSEEALKSASTVESLENQIAQLSSEKQLCERNLIKLASENTNYQEKIREGFTRFKHTRDRNVGLEAAAAELKESKAELEKEVDQMSKMVKMEVEQNIALKQKVSATETKAALFEGKVDDMKRQVTKIKFEKDRLEEIAKNYEQKIDKLARFEGNAKLLAEEASSNINDALLERDKSESKYALLQREVKRLQSEREMQVSKSLEECTEMIAMLEQKHALEIETKIAELKHLLAEHTRLKTENERYKNEKIHAFKKVKRLEILLQEERGNLRGQFEEINSRLKEVSAKCIVEQKHRESLEEEVREGKQLLTNMDNLKRIAETKLSEKHSDFEEKYSAINSKLSQVHLDMVKCKHESDRLKTMLAETVESYEDKIKAFELEKKTALSEAQMSVINSRQIAEDREKSLEQQRRTYKESLDQIKSSGSEVLRQLEKKLQEERERSKRLLRRNKELGDSIETMSSEKLYSENCLKEKCKDAINLRRALSEAEDKITELGFQIGASIEQELHRKQTR